MDSGDCTCVTCSWKVRQHCSTTPAITPTVPSEHRAAEKVAAFRCRDATSTWGGGGGADLSRVVCQVLCVSAGLARAPCAPFYCVRTHTPYSTVCKIIVRNQHALFYRVQAWCVPIRRILLCARLVRNPHEQRMGT